VLTVLGTIALPATAISVIYGMSHKGTAFEDFPHEATYVPALIIACTAGLLLKPGKWF